MKLFINDIILYVIYPNESAPKEMTFICIEELREFILLTLKTKDENIKRKTYGIKADSEKSLVLKLKKEFKYIKAAGGVVKNDEGQILVIKRNNKWDIPKGKAEKKEKMIETALREVKEECGLKHLSIGNQLITTYHFYKIESKVILKKTKWYNMHSTNTEELTPQLDEGITDVKWVTPTFFSNPEIKTFRSIQEVIKTFNEP